MYATTLMLVCTCLAVSQVQSLDPSSCHTSADFTSFLLGNENCDCNYIPDEDDAVVTPEQDTFDHDMIRLAHQIGVAGNPTFPFGAVIVDNRTNQVVCTGFNSPPIDWLAFSLNHGAAEVNTTNTSFWILHGEIVAMFNCTLGPLPDVHGGRNPNWPFMVLYTNIESCPMCFVAASYINLRRLVFGVSSITLTEKRCWTQHFITDKELAVHAVDGGKPFIDVRGPLRNLETNILKDFATRCT